MKNDVTLKSVLKKKLEDPEFKKAFDEEEAFANIAIQIAKLRQKSEAIPRVPLLGIFPQ